MMFLEGCKETVSDLHQQIAGQLPVEYARRIASSNRPKIRSWPGEPVCVRQHHPGPSLIKPESALGGIRDFDCQVHI